eukprot:858949-Rhodomonas_salina.2
MAPTRRRLENCSVSGIAPIISTSCSTSSCDPYTKSVPAPGIPYKKPQYQPVQLVSTRESGASA